ncbi:GntR family transcriptional regulator [Nostocoides australiense]|uniref:Transcriptional regulator, GntR family n=1 Tax=Nostocoides australiense Ben110 TaxID=1193182 RepID=W6JSU9_9MICO|nr:GntR family transcriptional regulator [Tetrasphaera australiensis]MCB1302334.1 GntR family transcriptional regulator [Tetrasphaera sp.]CCH72218.1 Transcriptional regulator, GntR family [Tetrasphaera australiensis Ben110]HPF80487.1 GntR family transcriptional regulator [Tetrasphaera australiensis]
MPLSDATVPSRRSLLRESVYEQLRDAIVDGSLAPGEKLNDQELAARLGVSRTPVREALLRLAQSGLVVADPGKSTVVADLDPTAVRHARDVVASMRSLAVRESVGRLTPEDVEAMTQASERYAAALADGDIDAALRADDDLHAVPVVLADNRAIDAVLAQFTPVIRRVERARFDSFAVQDSIARHAEFIHLCAAGDALAASDHEFETWRTLTHDGRRA